MFARRFFAGTYFAPRYYAEAGVTLAGQGPFARGFFAGTYFAPRYFPSGVVLPSARRFLRAVVRLRPTIRATVTDSAGV